MSIPTNVLRELSRLFDNTNYSNRYIGKILGIAPNSVTHYRKRFIDLQMNHKSIVDLDDPALLALLQLRRGKSNDKVMPDYLSIHERKSKNKYLSLQLLWEEYRAEFKENAYCYAQFTHYYRQFLKKIDISLRLTHFPGEAMFVDYAGTLIPWTDIKTKQQHKAQVFVAVLGHSNYTFVYASRSQKIEDWIQAHIEAFKFFGGVPEAVIPDNLKSAVTKAGPFPEINRSYSDSMTHYGTHILPSRVRKPQDKAKAEQGVLFATRWITAKLLEQQFFSLEEINTAIAELLPGLNQRSLRDYPGSRQSRFEENEKQALKPLPTMPYEYSAWQAPQKVPSDYHVKVLGHFYSVPFEKVGERVEIRVSQKVVEIFLHSKCIASHIRNHVEGGVTTNPQHLAPQHSAYQKQSIEHYLEWAAEFGEQTAAVVRAQYEGKRVDSMVANKACSQLQSLARLYDVVEFEAACARAVAIASPTVKSVRSILSTGLYKLEQTVKPVQGLLPLHDNVRGAGYYAQGGL